jgi:AbrB family looped-hinge helix DNA binding protein
MWYALSMRKATKAWTVSFSVKGQVVIPQQLRKDFEIEAGTKAHVESTPQGILILPLTGQHIRRLRGSLKGSGVMKALREDRAREREL